MATNIKPCPVSREKFERCCWASARYLFEEEYEWMKRHPEMYDRYFFFNPYDDLTDGAAAVAWIWENDKEMKSNYKPDVCAAICHLTPPTFRKRARQFLWPGKFGDVPEEFYAPPKEKESWRPNKEHSGYKANRDFADAREMVEMLEREDERAEEERKREALPEVKKAAELLVFG